ncbi:MAG: hypothetical protein ABSG13_25755 [Bryobacteraceae bacterium]|jgi:hypothetical protein
MARCNECNSVVTTKDAECYICGLPVPGAKKNFLRRKRAPKPKPPVTAVSNLLFMASLALTVVSFLCGQKMSLSFSATLSGVLLVARIISDRLASKDRLALSPVTVPRLDH